MKKTGICLSFDGCAFDKVRAYELINKFDSILSGRAPQLREKIKSLGDVWLITETETAFEDPLRGCIRLSDYKWEYRHLDSFDEIRTVDFDVRLNEIFFYMFVALVELSTRHIRTKTRNKERLLDNSF